MKKLIIIVLPAIIALYAAYFVSTGFNVRNDVVVQNFFVSEDGKELAFEINYLSPMGFVRGYKDNGGGVKSHYLKFYSTFGGIHSTLGAKNEFVLNLDKDDSEIYFNRADGGYELVLEKNEKTGIWEKPYAGDRYVTKD